MTARIRYSEKRFYLATVSKSSMYECNMYAICMNNSTNPSLTRLSSTCPWRVHTALHHPLYTDLLTLQLLAYNAVML